MPFFLPERLIGFEYIGGEPDPEYEKLAKGYQNEIDFAFFAVNFGYSKRDYADLTSREKAFILKAYEEKIVTDSTLLRNAVLNAVSNALRKKGRKFKDLWKKRPKHLDSEKANENLNIVLEVEKKEGKSWIDRVLKANGLKQPERRN